MEEDHEEEIERAQDEGNKEMWKLFYELKDLELLEKYPKTTTNTIYRCRDTLDWFTFNERVGLPPLPGGREQQPEEWVLALECAYSAKAEADEEINLERKLKDLEERNEGARASDSDIEFDEE